MSAGEVATFEANPYFADAVRLRLWDDEAKVPGLPTAELSRPLNMIQKAAVSSAEVR